MSEKPSDARSAAENENPPDEQGIEKLRKRKKKRNIVLIGVLSLLTIGLGVVTANVITLIRNPMSAFTTTFDTGLRADSTPLPDDDRMTPDGVDAEDEAWESEEAAFEDDPWIEEDETSEAIVEDSEPHPTPAPTINPEQLLASQSDPSFMKSRLNLLLLGIDYSPERAKQKRFYTDAMVLVSVDFDNGRVDLISIPRDSYVKIYNRKYRDAINAAFSMGGGMKNKTRGYEYAAKTVSKLFGNIPIHDTIGFDMTFVKELVNAMGGVDYNVDIDVEVNGRTLEPGLQHLDGQRVLDYCRMIEDSTDVERAKRQQSMLLALFDQFRQTSQWTRIPALYQTVIHRMDTQLNTRQISSLALFASRLSPDAIHCHIVPGAYVESRKKSYWGISNEEQATLIEEVFAIQDPKLDALSDLANLQKKAKQSTKKPAATKKASPATPKPKTHGAQAAPPQPADPTRKPVASTKPRPSITHGAIDLFDIPEDE